MNAYKPKDPDEAAKFAASLPDKFQALCERLKYLLNQGSQDDGATEV